MSGRRFELSRRTILRGLGASIALPYLEVMGAKTVAAAAGKADPPRLACFYIPGGIAAPQWYPKETGFKYTLAPSHKPLEKHREQFSLLTGLSHIEGRISGHPHAYNWLTGHNINLTPGTITNTVSMDQVAAKHIGQTYLPSLTLSWTSGVGKATLSRNGLGADIPATGNYREVFERLFPPADKAQIRQAKQRLALDQSVLDTAVGSVHDLKAKLGRVDQQRLEQYLDAIRDVETRIGRSERILAQGRPKFDEKSVRLESKAKNSMAEHIELMMDLIALAFQTDMTRVVTQSLGGEGGPNYTEYQDWAKKHGARLRGAHDYHHKGGGGRGGSDGKVLAERDALYSASLARLMDKLQAVETTDGTLLDHTVLLMGGSQVSSHSGKNFPMLLAGGKKLGFRHGQHVKWKRDEKSASDLYLTILQQMRCPVTQFKESTGPLSELIV
ncbi:MAG: DUF1552 domain-containing protein [Phycisphaeraceae bacterium]|nr:DUF1552 domain-containing protein [Phycisphaeraceae bacterium]